MIKNVVIFVLLFVCSMTQAQDYFQQDVDYNIKVRLVDSIHTLRGDIEITYKNNAPDELKEIYMHLWGNAFKNRTTAFSKQKIRTFDTKFYYAEDDDYGYYEDLDFKVNGSTVPWSLSEEHIDIARIELREGLKPGGVIVIKTAFSLRIPNSFSRLGHVGNTYQMTQWYPKPAVYDSEGWHAMPYLDMGEFYSEFGDYEVEITLPENYYVGASGELKNESEILRLAERVEYTTAYLQDSLLNHRNSPPSSKKMKTLNYRAENVHDFAWFADKRFLVQKDIATLVSGKKVDCWVYFTDYEKDLWKDGAFFVKRAVEFYSDRVGDYPYPQATAVQSALSAGAGMEYPMITVIGGSGSSPALDQVITHEVGHNWFYGILGSNERDYPWMDEGMNSYHDHKYTDIYYTDFDQVGGIMPAKIKKQLEYSALAYVYQIYARLGKDQAPNTNSNELTMVNYFLGAYEKPAMAFKVLENYIGEERVIASMKAYYDEWKFKHPQPEDTKASFEKSTGMDLGWLFDGMLFSNQVYDYEITKIDPVSKKITVRNNGTVAAPLSLNYRGGEADTSTYWEEGFIGSKEIELHVQNAEIVEIDDQRISLDIKPANNDVKGNGKSIPGKPRVKFLTGVRTSAQNKLFVVPVVGYNTANQFQIGLALHNYSIPLSKFQYYITPMIGARDNSLVGSFQFRQDFPLRQGTLRNVSIALGGKSFHESYNERFDYSLRFTKIQPSIDFEWKRMLVSPISHHLRYRPIGIITESANFVVDAMGTPDVENINRHLAVIHDLEYRYVRRSPISPLEIKTNAEYRAYVRGDNENQYLKLYASVDAKYAYKRGKFFEIRGFGGFFPIHTEKEISTTAALGNFSMFHRGVNDYRYDHNFLDRRGQDGFLSRQVTRSDGGFKNGITNSMPLGLSNNYMLAVNLAVDLPYDWSRKFPIKPYFDAGVYSYKATSSEAFQQQVLYSGGLMLDFQKTIMIHFPLFSSEEINNVYAQTADSFWKKISFTIDLNQLDPHRLKHWFYR